MCGATARQCNMGKLPFFISVPHGGTEMPEELAGHACITAKDLFDDSDACTREIYALEAHVAGVHAASIARAFVDLNRARDMMPPEYPDGVVKSATCYNKPVYKEGMQPGARLTKTLLDRHYKPYHDALREGMRNPDVVLGLDCHTMAAAAPAVAPDSGKRPLVCLGDAEGKACDPEWTRLLQQAFIRSFGITEEEVTINDPFKGGFITRTHGQNPKPWIQVELNRSMYLTEPWFNKEKLVVDPCRLTALNQLMFETLKIFHLSLARNKLLPEAL